MRLQGTLAVYQMTTLGKLILISMSLVGMAGCTTISEPRLTPVAPSTTETRLLEQARVFYGQGQFSAALDKAHQALDQNAASIEALYAIASCDFQLENYRESLVFAHRAAKYRSDFLLDIYLLLGSNYERLDDPWNALRTYRFAGEYAPDNPVAHYRIAQTYLYLGKPELAAEAFKTVVRLDPRNPESHFQLGMLYAENGYRVPALLALSTALLYEPEKGPAGTAHETIDLLLTGRTVKDNTTGKIKIDSAYLPGTDEGDFTIIEKALAGERVSLQKTGVSDNSAAMIEAQYASLFREIAKIRRGHPESFVSEYYIPFYQYLIEQNVSDAAVKRIFQGGNHQIFRAWIRKHPTRTKRLTDTLNNYAWPAES